MPNDLGLTSDAVAASYEGTIAVSEVAWVEQKIDEAVTELKGLIPNIVNRVDSGKLDRDLVKDKVVAAVLRVVRNPKGIETEGEGDYSIKLRNTVASGDIWFPEKDLLMMGWEAPQKKSMPRTVHARATPGWGFPS